MNVEDMYLSLSMMGYGYENISKISRYLGDIKNLFCISENQIKEIPSISDKMYHRIISCRKNEYIQSLKKTLKNENIKYVTMKDDIYPKNLKRVYNPPIVIFAKGNLNILKKFSIGVVGSRKPSTYGIECSRCISRQLSSCDIAIVSGMAVGIDYNAHAASMDQVGKTIAVLGSSIDRPYPAQNKRLMHQIIENQGLIVSEYGIDVAPRKYHFPMRNRIISGISQGVLVVEAGIKSGSLITAEHALEQGKNVFAIPGNIDSSNSKGTNSLIKDGAMLVDSAQDILDEYGIENIAVNEICDISLSSQENKIVNILKVHKSLHIDYICNYCRLNIKDVFGVLQVLEIKGIINEVSNKVYSIRK